MRLLTIGEIVQKQMDITPIEVDYREDATTAGGLVFRLGANGVVPRATLPFGDLLWATEQCTYGVELKSVSDFFGSLWSKDTGERLEFQLNGLRETVDVQVLGIHGVLWGVGGNYWLFDRGYFNPGKGYLSHRGIKPTGMRVESVEGFLSSISQQGVTVIYRPSKDGLLDALVAYYLESAKDSKTTFNHHLSGGRFQAKDPKYAQYMDVMLAVRGLGEERATELLKTFGSPRGVFTAEEKEILKVKGIGKGTVVKIKEALG